MRKTSSYTDKFCSILLFLNPIKLMREQSDAQWRIKANIRISDRLQIIPKSFKTYLGKMESFLHYKKAIVRGFLGLPYSFCNSIVVTAIKMQTFKYCLNRITLKWKNKNKELRPLEGKSPTNLSLFIFP